MNQNKKIVKKFIGIFITGALIGGLFLELVYFADAVSQETQTQIEKTEQEKEQLEEELLQKQEEKETLILEKEEQEDQVIDLKTKRRLLEEELSELELKEEKLEEEIQKTEGDLEQAGQWRDEKAQAMKLRIKYLYENSQEDLLSLCIEKGSIIGALNYLEYCQKLNQYDREQLKEYEESQKVLEAYQQKLETAKEEQTKLLEQTQEKQQELASMEQQAKDQIAQYLEEITNKENEILSTEEELQQKSQTLQDLYERAWEEEEAVRIAQAENESAQLGEAIAGGNVTIIDAGIHRNTIELTEAEMELLTAMIYCESRGEPYEGQLAVGHVIMNRVRSSKFPNTLEEVLRQNLQFQPAGSGTFDIILCAYREQIPGVIHEDSWNSCRRAAESCVNGESNIGDCLFFRTHKPVPLLEENLKTAGVPYWKIANHIFYYSWVAY